MFSSVSMMLALAAVFLALILNLAASNRFHKALTRYGLVIVGAAGIFFYGYGYAWTQGLNLISFLKALFSLCKMFVGSSDLDAVKAAPLFQSQAVLAAFWLTHFLAYYVMASAAITTVGQRFLRVLRVTLLRRGPLLLIYGVNARSVAYGRERAGKGRCGIVYVDQEYDSGFDSSIRAFGAVVEKHANALAGNARFLKQLNIKPGKRRMEVAVLKSDADDNLRYARNLLQGMAEAGIRPEQTSLIASGAGETAASLQALGSEGYGSVYAFDDYDIAAWRTVRACPPWETVAFDGQGKATEDFHAVIVGFGRTGRAVLNQLVVNGQFHGSRFRTDVFDPSAQNGYLYHRALEKEYDVRFHTENASAQGFYAFLEENLETVREIVLCTGKADRNREIADDLLRWLSGEEQRPVIVLADRDEVRRIDSQGGESSPEAEKLPDPEEMDAVAMQVNQIYRRSAGSKASAEENWRACGYADRQSCRACATFFPAMLRAAGVTEAQALEGKWPPEEGTLENLARTEHLRWCAYHIVQGWAPMPREEWDRRAEAYRHGANPGYRISRDDGKRLHACLVPWEALPELSRRENEVTGGTVDYLQADRNNVLILAEAVRAGKRPDRQSHE